MGSRAGELHGLSDSELVESLERAKQELFNLRFRHATGQLENTARLAEARRDVARCKTVVREREILAAEAADLASSSAAREGQ